MLQKNKFITLRYVTNTIKSKNLSDKPNKPQKPNAKDFQTKTPTGLRTNTTALNSATRKYLLDMDNYTDSLRQPNYVQRKILPQEELLSEQIRFYVEEISYEIEIGNDMFLGLSNADLVNWYIKPIKISLKGVSVVSSNMFLGSDNIILDIYNKLQEKLSEVNYNYFTKPNFRLVVENGLKNLDNFKGVITSLSFSEKANIPDSYNFSLNFVGKPINEEKRNEAIRGETESEDLNNTYTTTNVGKATNQKIGR